MKKQLSYSVHKKDGSRAIEFAGLAVDALTFLAADAERLDRFFAITGLSPSTVRRAACDPGFAESLLDYLASDERLLVAFAAEHGYDPARLEAHRQALTPRADEA